MKPEEYVIIILFVGIIIKVTILDGILAFYGQLTLFLDSFYNSLLGFLFSWIGVLSLAIILTPFIIYLNYRFNIKLSQKLEKKKTRIKKTKDEKENIEKLLKTDIDNLNIKELSEFIINIDSKIDIIKEFKKLDLFEDSLWSKRQKSTELLKKLKREDELKSFREEREKLREENEEIKKESERLKREQENKIYAVLRELDADRNNVFLRNELSDEEIDSLHKDGFEDANEYNISERRIIPVLVKKIMNHSKTHTFLVWSIRQLLEDFEVEDIEEHETRYPDITFTHDGQEYAIEVELGSLLRKKKQAKDKVSFLNRNYRWRWMFVVSNKNLLSKYRKLGSATQRSEVEKKVKEWLNSDI